MNTKHYIQSSTLYMIGGKPNKLALVVMRCDIRIHPFLRIFVSKILLKLNIRFFIVYALRGNCGFPCGSELSFSVFLFVYHLILLFKRFFWINLFFYFFLHHTQTIWLFYFLYNLSITVKLINFIYYYYIPFIVVIFS